MIAFIIGLSGDQKNLVSRHHLFVGMTFLANLRVKLLAKLHGLGLIPLEQGNLVEAMAIAAGG